ncbi:hypothetical protein MTR67_052094, partial [Solanum verrucosum]
QLSEACEKSFQVLKNKLTSTPVLTLPYTNGFVVYCDASRIGLGCVLLQNDLNLRKRRWLELLNEYNMSVLYYPRKANVVGNALSRLSMGSVSHIEDGKKELVQDVHRLSCL